MNQIFLKDVNVKKFMKLLQNTLTFKKNMLTLYIDGGVIKSFSKNDSGSMFKYIESDLSEYCTETKSSLEERGTVIFTSAEKIINVMKNLGTEECDITIEFTKSDSFGMLSRIMKISNKFFDVNLPAMSELLCDVISTDIYFKDEYVNRFVNVPDVMSFNIPDIKQIMSCLGISADDNKFVIYAQNDSMYLSQLADTETKRTFDEVANAQTVFRYNLESTLAKNGEYAYYSKDNFLQVNPNNEYTASIITLGPQLPLKLKSDGVCRELYVMTNIIA